ncbi:terminase small subunit [Rheinheimera sp. MMS21-TC3]|uniref:terminase small subunit n=1 Tax=Rheinheimera sp. MMS21-TC3 TaxID=3072790 RepID=UPI0028C492F1|nr:terminase small subunit [Rheinheimera sp. MMS21-TC3]WNO60436.1 terminase small subunit [Rheinheimera sp. MMS21-TC3]
MSELKPYDKWTAKEKLFAHEYLIDSNMTAAAIRAGYSERTAKSQGHEIYHKPYIKAWIEQRVKQHLKKLDISAEAILQEVALIGFQNLAGAYNKDGTLMNIHDMPEAVQRTIASIEVDELRDPDGDSIGRTSKLRVTDKLKALEMLGKHEKLWTDKIELSDRPMVYVKDMTGRKKKGAE